MALNSLGLGFLLSAKDLASPELKKLNRNFDKLKTNTETASASMTSSMKSLGVGAAAMAVGFAGLKVLGGTVDNSRRFGKSIAEVSTLVDEATFSTEKMKQITQEAAATFGIDAFQQAPALYQAISSGATDVESATNLMDSANKFAIGGVTDLTTSVDALSSATNSYGIDTLSTADAADTMFVAIRAGKTTAEELGSQLGKVTPLANASGLSFQELNAAIAATTAQGIRTRQSVTGMKAALANIAKPTADAKKEAKRMGIEFDAAALRSKGLAGFLDSVTGSAKFNEDSMTKLFGSIEAVNTITALTSDNSAKFRDVMGQMDGRAGAADAAFGKMNNTLDAQINRFGALKDNIKITMGEALAPFVSVAVSGLTKVFNLFASLPGPVKTFLAILTGLLFTLIAIGGAVLFVTSAMKLLALGVAAGMIPSIGGLITSFSILGTVAMAALGPILAAMAPFILIGLAIAAAIGVIVGAFFLLRMAYRKNFLGFKTLIDFIVRGFKIFWAAIKFAFNFYKKMILETVDSLSSKLVPIIEWVGGVMASVGEAVMFVWGKVKAFVAPIIDWMAKKIDKLMGAAGWVVDKFNSAKGWADGVVDDVKGGINAALDAGEDLFGIGGTDPVKPGLATAGAGGGSPGPAFASQFSQPKASGGKAKTTVVKPSDVNINTTIQLDGEAIASVVKRVNADDKNRRSQS